MPEPTTLTNSVLPGAGYVHLNQPVTVPCVITLSPDTLHWERVPVYRCLDGGPYVALLGVDNPSGHPLTVQLERAHAAGAAVRVKSVDVEDPQGKVEQSLPALAERIRDRVALVHPDATEAALLAVLDEHQPWEQGWSTVSMRTGRLIDTGAYLLCSCRGGAPSHAISYPCPTVRAIAKELGIELANA